MAQPDESSEDLNVAIADRFEEVAAILEDQGANPFRVDAYRRAAFTVRRAPPVDAILAEEGLEGLERLPGIGRTLARAIRDFVATGRMPMLDRLRAEHDPEALLASIPGIGRRWAARIHHELGIDTLADLEAAAYDGRLAKLPRFGKKRLEGVRAALAVRLRRAPQARSGRRGPGLATPALPPVAELLDVDREYRERAERGELRLVAPTRFNPERRAWLPVLHTHRDGREYTALYSNTERAHRLGRTRDWVVIYYDGPGGDGQATVVTERAGRRRGQRVVRGREAECPDLQAEAS
jgi:hypothetical protein